MAGTLLGCMPNNFVFCNAGNRLGELQSLRDLYDVKLLLIGMHTCSCAADRILKGSVAHV